MIGGFLFGLIPRIRPQHTLAAMGQKLAYIVC